MKVLFDHSWPFALAHGGFQIQIEQTKAALEALNVQVEFVRWWDDSQRGDLIHYFGRPLTEYIYYAHERGMKVVMAELLTGLGSRSTLARALQKGLTRLGQSCLPAAFTGRLAWKAYQTADALVALTPWEGQLMVEMFDAPSARVHCIPNGVEDVFLNGAPHLRGHWLVCAATITERKRVLELAQAAVHAQVPVWIVGKPYAESDPYSQRFIQLARQHPSIIRYEGPATDRVRMADIYRQARGFVLLSTRESLSLSALEAAACGCPLLLSDLPWSRCTFQANASYCPVTSSVRRTADGLRRFYERAPDLRPPPKPKTWLEVGEQFRALYEALLQTSR